MTLRFTLGQLEYPVAVAECGSVALVAERLNVGSASNSAAISRLEAGFGLQLFIRCQAQADRAPDGLRRLQVPVGGRVRPIRRELMLPWRQPRRTVQGFLDQARKNVTVAQLSGLTGGAP